MKTYTSANFTSNQPCVTALGCFDGVHAGHSYLILEAKRLASELEAICAVWSFSNPPKNYFKPQSVPILTTPAEKRIAISRLGVDVLVSVPFDKSIATLSAEDFFSEILINRMNSKHVVCGFNYRFGKGGLGDVQLLEELCSKHGIGLSVIPAVTIDGITVSSSAVRAALEEGKIALVGKLLNRPYSIRSKVINGKHLGRTLGFPTINQSFECGKAVPARGVYISRIMIGRLTKYGITNIGIQPTVTQNALRAETHIFDFGDNLYEKTVTVELLDFLRPEEKFLNINTLTKQVEEDIKKAKKIIKSYQ